MRKLAILAKILWFQSASEFMHSFQKISTNIGPIWNQPTAGENSPNKKDAGSFNQQKQESRLKVF